MAVYAGEPDAGLHGAAEWLLRKWKQNQRLKQVIEKLKSDERQLQARKSTDKRQWFVNSQKQTFVIVDANGPRGEFRAGSPASEPGRYLDESLHRRRIGRRYAIAAHELTKQEFDELPEARLDVVQLLSDEFVKTGDSPQVAVSWYGAARYCNWLSEREGIAKDQWCYQPNKKGKYAAGMKAKEKFWELTGYRLPTEAEWEYACRAGTITSHYYGLAQPLLPQYGWYLSNSQNRARPVGGLKPNDFGLFDMLGNSMEWCFDAYASYPTQGNDVVDDAPPTQAIEENDRRILRSGQFPSQPRILLRRLPRRRHTEPPLQRLRLPGCQKLPLICLIAFF